MLSEKFQRKIYETCKDNPDAMVANGKYLYQIAYNHVASIHTWIIRRKRYGLDLDWHWLQPLDVSIY